MKRPTLLMLAVAGAALAAATGCRRSTGPAQGRRATPATTRPAASAHWPVFRGSTGMLGLAEGSLPDALQLRWTFATGDMITSSPVVAEGLVFIGSMDANVYGIDLDAGKKVWSFPTGDAVEAPPTWLDGTLYVGSNDSFLYALDARTGKLKWRYETQDKILGAASYFRDPQTKKLRLVVGSYDFNLYCLDPPSGKLLWKYKSGNYINGGVAVAAGRTVFGGCDATIHVVSPDGNEAATIEAGAYVAATPAFDGRRVYVGNYEGAMLCADVAARKVVWQYEGEEPFVSSPAVTADRVLVGSRDGGLYCLDRASGKKRWVFPTRDEINSSPVVCGGKVVVGSNDGRLYVVHLADGKRLWQYDLGQPVGSSPAVAGGFVIVGCDDGNVYAFGPKG